MVRRPAHGTYLGATPRPHGAVGAPGGPIALEAGAELASGRRRSAAGPVVLGKAAPVTIR
jgi:hypothetical protein